MIQTLRTDTLEIAYEQDGRPGDRPVLLLHGWPDDVRTWDAVVPHLTAAGCCVYRPWLRGFGPTRFLHAETERSGQRTALAQDAHDFLAALGLSSAVVVGHDWGARLGYVLAALWPESVRKLVTLSGGYEVKLQHGDELPPAQGHAYWYQWFFHTERGVEALRDNRRELCRYLWKTWAPHYHFTDEVFETTAAAWDNPDWVEITLHCYRFRWAAASPAQRYAELEARWSAHPEISVPTLLLHGAEDGASLAPSSAGKEHLFTGPYERHLLSGLGHFPQREDPETVARHVLSVL